MLGGDDTGGPSKRSRAEGDPPRHPGCEHAQVPKWIAQPFVQCPDCGLFVIWAMVPGQEQPIPVTTPNVPGTIRRLADFADWLEEQAVRREMAAERGRAHAEGRDQLVASDSESGES